MAETGGSLRGLLERVLPQTEIIALANRDDKSDDEVAAFDGITLTKRNLESYLLADDVLEALLQREGKLEFRDQALQLKAEALQDSIQRGNRTD